MEGSTIESEVSRPSVLNRFRQHPRVRIAAPFVCALSPLRPKRWLRRPTIDLGLVYDLSERGARVSTEASIKPGDEVMLTLRLPKQIRSAEIAVATVRWTKDQFFGLAFRRLSPDAHGRLKKFVAIASKLTS
ncbi:MAG TPA: PilZ domain-containing protein [Nitrospira sp.]|nr:PilZ domain-containing protein [Nitrospira sp.]